MHAAMPGSAAVLAAFSRPPTCAHVTPRQLYVLSSAALTSAVTGNVPVLPLVAKVWSLNFMWSATVLAAAGLQ